jgi:hypothetical protein
MRRSASIRGWRCSITGAALHTEKNSYEFAVDDFNEAIRLDPQIDGYGTAPRPANASHRAPSPTIAK